MASRATPSDVLNEVREVRQHLSRGLDTLRDARDLARRPVEARSFSAETAARADRPHLH